MQFVIKGIGCDNLKRLRHGRDRREVGFITTITTNICEYEFHSGEVYSDWRQVGTSGRSLELVQIIDHLNVYFSSKITNIYSLATYIHDLSPNEGVRILVFVIYVFSELQNSSPIL
jgi:hypothetical protein